MRLALIAIGGALAIGWSCTSTSFAGPTGADPDFPRSMATIATTTVAPRIDGRVVDDEWSAASVGQGFRVSGSTRLSREFTEVRVMADGEFLYVAFVCGDSQAWRLNAQRRPTLSEFQANDRVTVEIAVEDVASAPLSFAVNALGVQLAPAVDARDWQTAAARGDFGWSAEMAIPLGIVGTRTARFGGAIDFLRYHSRTRETSQWSGNVEETSAAPTPPLLMDTPDLTTRPLDSVPTAPGVPPMPSGSPPAPATPPSVPSIPSLDSVPPIPDTVPPPDPLG